MKRKRSIRKALQRRNRKPGIESLEARHLLAVDWRNPVDALDVTADGFAVPIDVIQIINTINADGARQLSRTRDPSKPYWDTNGDQFVTAIDALLIINAINAQKTSPYTLQEGDRLTQDAPITITVGQTAGARTYRLQVAPNFDTSDQTATVEDVLSIYLVPGANSGTTLLDRGVTGSAIFSLSETRAEFVPGLVRWNGQVVDIDLSGVSELDTAVLRMQLMNSDSDRGSRVTITPLSNDLDLGGNPRPTVAADRVEATVGAALDLTDLTPQGNVDARFENVRFDPITGRYAADLRLANLGDAIAQRAAVAFPGLPAGISLVSPSGTTDAGAPYLNVTAALPRGGLRRNAVSATIPVQFDNPNQVPFVLQPQVLGRLNRAPTFDAIANQTVMPGGILRIPLVANDADGDTVTFTLNAGGAAGAPTGELTGGSLIFRPAPADLGTYPLDVTASDGALEVTRSFTLNVVADPVTTTRISGQVLKVNGDPLVNMLVEIGGVQGLTLADGSFLLDLGGGPVVSDTIKVRGERFAGAPAGTYPFIAEKLPLVLEHTVYPGFNNVIDRPIYLPELNVAGGTTIDPMQDTTVRQTIRPGETAEVFVPAGTLMNQQGTPFTGTLSITEVPPELTPAALPEGLNPDLVVTIQPGEMVFGRPAPLSLPNRAGYPAGKILDLWSINPVTGAFEDVGNSQVSADGKTIDTISGGVRNSSWHFVADPPIASPQRPQRYNPKQGCPACPNRVAGTSEIDLHSGALTEMHDLVTYQSQGQQRGVQLVYDSLRADPRPILHFGIDEIDAMDLFPSDVERVRFSAHLSVQRGDFSLTVPGAENVIPGMNGFGGGFHYNLADYSHFWKLPEGRGAADGALQIDLRDQPTGVYRYDLDTGVYFRREVPPPTLVRINFVGTATNQTDDLLIVNAIDSPFGAGWGITGWQQIVEGANRRKLTDIVDRTTMIVDGGGTELLFKLNPTTNQFMPPPGDFSVLEKLTDGTYRRTTPDQTVYQFNSRMQLATMTDRNHNVTTYGYDGAGKLISITDPVGLVTTFTYTGDRVTKVTDPAQRQTLLTYDNAGNLTRVTDPDNSTRTWRYDADHHMTGETDQLGRTEESIFGFHGRVTEARRKDGTVVHVNAPEVLGLLLPDATCNFQNPPRMARLTFEAVASYVDGNGNVQQTSLDGAGQSLGQTDAVGANPFVTRDANNLPATSTNARGFESSATFDDRGNMLTSRDSLSVRVGDEPGLIGLMTGTNLYFGEVDHYSFQGKAGELIHSDVVQGQSFPSIYLADDPTQSFSSGAVPADGEYRADVSGLGPYAIRLLSLGQSPVLPLGVTSGNVVKGQDFAYRVTLQGDQRLRIVDATPQTERNWSLRGADGSFLSSNYSAANTTYEFIAPQDGEYFVIGDARSTATLDLMPFSFTATVTMPDQQVAKSGFNVTHSGTLQQFEERVFPITAPVGTLIYLDHLVLEQPYYGSAALRDATGTHLASLGGPPVRLPDSGEFQIVVSNFNNLATDFAFRMLDLAAAPTLAVGESLDSTIQNGQAEIYRFTGIPGQRVITRSGTETFSNTFTKQIFFEIGTQPMLADNQVLTIAEDTQQFLIFDSSTASEDFLWRSFDARLARPLTLDQDLRGRFTVGDDRKYYRFTAQPGTYLFNEKLESNITRGAVFDEQGESWNDTFHDRISIGLRSPTFPPEASHEYFLVASMDEQIFLPHDFGFHLHSLQTSTDEITIGQTVTGQLDWVETDVYTFEGRAGQWLYFDARRFETTPDSAVTATLTGPNGIGASVGIGRTQDSGPFQLTETGTYRIELNSRPFNFESVIRRDYQFRLLDLSETPFASLSSPLERPLPNGASVAIYRFTATNGQRVTFTQADPATTSLRVFNPRGTQVSDSGTDSSLTMTFVETGTHYLVVSARDQSLGGSVASRWTITDASDPAVTPSGFGTLHEGAAGEGELIATFQGNAGMRVLLQQASDGGFTLLNFHVQGPSGETVANLQVSSGDQFIVLPRSGAYTVRLVGINFPISSPRTYKFVLSHVQDLPLIAFGSTQPIASDNLGSHFRIEGTVGQQLLIDTILPDNVEATFFLGVGATVLDPVTAAPLSSSLVTIPRSGNYVLRASLINTPVGAVRVLDVAAAPQLALDIPATGTRTQVHEDVLLKFTATANEKRLFQFNTSNWQITNLSHPDRYVSLQLASREITPGNTVFEGVTEFPETGDYAIVGYGQFANPLDYSATMSVFTEPTAPLIGGALSHTEYAYEPAFNQVTSKLDEQGRRSLLDIDPANGNVRSATQVIGTVGGGNDFVMTMTYTASGQIDTMTDPLGRVTDFDYDARGRVITITSAKGLPEQTVERFEYDLAGNLTAAIDANGQRTTYEYDALNRRTKMTEPDPDGAGPLASPVTQLTYDAVGNVTAATDALGHVTRQAYDTRDRVISSTDANNQVTTYGYDQNGNVTATTDPLDRVTRMRYDARNRMIASVDLAGYETRFAYDLDNNLRSVTDASGNVTSYQYDARGRRIAEIDPFGNTTTFVYNGVNEIVVMNDRLDRVTKLDYDDAGRLSRERWFDAAGTVVNTLDYSYDAAGRLVRVQDESSDLRVTFDALDRPTRNESGGVAGVPAAMLDATFDAVGNLLTMTDTIQSVLGGTNAYTYDALDRPTRLTQTSAVGSTNPVAEKRVNFAYNALGQFTTLSRFGDLAGTQAVAATTFTYDTLNRVTDITHRSPSNNVLNSFALTFNAASRITAIADIDGVTDYLYDSRDQLTGADHADAANPDETYAYDATGNRTSSQRHGTGYATGDGNRLTADGTNSYEYDAEGNLVKQTTIASGAVREFAWDHRNRLVGVTDRPSAAAAPTQIVDYAYDAMNRRIAKSVGGATTYFFYDRDEVLVELTDPDASGPQSAVESMRYLHGPAVDQFFAQEDAAGDVEWHLTDHLGTVRDLVDDTGAVVNHLKYDSFGNVISQSNPATATRYQFTGREFDAETGLNFYRARYYDASIGRFLSEDPIGFTSNDMNLFRYVTNDPLRNVDPYGYQASDGTNEINASIVENVRTNRQNYANLLYDAANPNFNGLNDPRENSQQQESLDKPTPEFMEKFLNPPKLSWLERLRLRFSKEGRQTLCEYDETMKTFERDLRDARRQAFRSYLERNYTPKS